MAKIFNLFKRKEKVVDDIEVATHWVCDLVTEPLKNNLTKGKAYELHEGEEYKEEYYFYDDLGKRQSWYDLIPGHYIKK
ncbi:MAG: hypothetical protein PHT02_07015 [Tissierellia bacterium]|nr:hypothetical protein [Tissierellia bacterium]